MLKFGIWNCVWLVLAVGGSGQSWAQGNPTRDPLRGLWVGEATLNFVNEVTVPLDRNNNPVAPDPTVPTLTADRAQVRLLLHVNGAGQAHLLKDVAILNRRPASGPGVAGEAVASDLALVTDPRLYHEFPPQPAVRWGTVTLDFGDSRATRALDELVNRLAPAAAGVVRSASDTSLRTELGRRAVEAAAATAGRNAAAGVLTEADVAAAFDAFMRDVLRPAVVNDIAVASDPALEAQKVRSAAVSLENGSFYGDGRAVAMVDAVVAAALAGGTDAEKRERAQQAAGSFADVADEYSRFVAGKLFGDMMLGASAAAAQAGVAAGASEASIRLAVNGDAAVVAARSYALSLRANNPYDDTRATRALETVLEAIIGEVTASLPAESGAVAWLRDSAYQAGQEALASAVAPSAVSPLRPTLDYNAFVRSEAFLGSAKVSSSVVIAAEAAGVAAVSERVNNSLYTVQSVENAARLGAVTALRSVYSAAARAQRTELPLAGVFGPGSGDPRLTQAIRLGNQAPLGAAGLTGQIFLPANHPTNPFRHRRHPEHAVGVDVERQIRFDFDGAPGDPLRPAGFGVERLTGVYREEVFGLHKPLGPGRDIGLRVEGLFELRRVSGIDALNAQ